ncbi:hypothetical protein GIB67_019539 [Kingdonia uniflora]|uniref:Thioredoxin domain-containing protein n=1 Tax=Kingdonia uniflora TaxID=39325 RepID=A0A7J7N081_9MAGN|nr:hypothetical protein GIB67_019539 [Kingdonia uniflora]
MGKTPPNNLSFCLKWPWDIHQNPNSCTFETPFLINSIQTIGLLAYNLFNSATQTLDHTIKSLNPNQIPNLTIKPTKKKQHLSPEEQGEAEHRALASALASGKEATIIEFYSPKCRLCTSLLDLVMQMEARNSEWLSIVMADAENENWLPESRSMVPWECYHLFNATVHLLDGLDEFQIDYCYKEANKCAIFLSTFVTAMGETLVDLGDIPPNLACLIEDDALGKNYSRM